MSDNTEAQSKAIDKIHSLAKKSKMLVFILCDEDLQIHDDGNGFSQAEKDEIWEQMHEVFLDQFHEALSDVVIKIQNNR